MPKKKYNVEPTEKQKRFAKNLVENGGNKNKAALKANYSKAMAKNPHKITKSAGFRKLLEKYPDEPILEAIYKDALSDEDKRNATKNRDMFLKLKDRYPASKHKIDFYEEELKDLTRDK